MCVWPEIESPASEEACNGSANEKEVDLGSHGHVQPNGSICTCDEILGTTTHDHDPRNRNVGCQQLTPFLLSHRVVHSIVPGTFGKKTEQTRWKCFTLAGPWTKEATLKLINLNLFIALLTFPAYSSWLHFDVCQVVKFPTGVSPIGVTGLLILLLKQSTSPWEWRPFH